MDNTFSTPQTYLKSGYTGDVASTPAYQEIIKLRRLPNTLREAMLQRGLGNECMVYEALLLQNCPIGQWQNRNEWTKALAEAYGMRPETVKSALRHHVFGRGAIITQGKIGRPHAAFKLPTIEQMLIHFVSWTKTLHVAHDVLPEDAYQSLKTYRAHMHSAFIARMWINAGKIAKGVEISRQFMAQRLSVTTRTLLNYEDLIGVEAIAQYSKEHLEVGIEWNLPATKDNNRAQWLEAIEPNTGTITRYPAVRAIAAKLIKEGLEVYLVKQLVNRYLPDHRSRKHALFGKYADYINTGF